MRQAERVFVVEFKTAAQQFVTAVTEQQTEIECLALLDFIDHITRLVVHRFITNTDRIERAEPCQPIPAVLHLDAVQVFGRFQFDPAFEHGPFGPLVAFKSNLAQSDFRPRPYHGAQINEHMRCVCLPAHGRNLDRRIRKAFSILIGAQPLNKVLQPKPRIGRLRLHDPACVRRRVETPFHLSCHRADQSLQTLLDRELQTDRAGCIIPLEMSHLGRGMFEALSRQRFGEVPNRTVEPGRGVDARASQRHQEAGFNKERFGLRLRKRF